MIWTSLGRVDELKTRPLQELTVDKTKIALTYIDGQFSAVSGVCNHVGGPLGKGHLDGKYIVCPWHHWKFHCQTGDGEPGFESDQIPRYVLKEESGELLIDLSSKTPRK
ncbi:MAG: Rieske 2Fe-2S domain-containing protein, partial [Bdellovibrionales bacterium]|nr:Rieske 2Fe-2S domain-containing protein [Bdellovibrionales bacterium]